MKILIPDAYFYPERIAFSHLEQDILQGLVEAGHTVELVCPTPCRGITKEERKKYRSIRHETLNGVIVTRYYAPNEGKSPVKRALRYLWCNLRQGAAARRCRDADAVFAVSTPPTQGYFAGRLAKRRGVPFVYSLQDLFPESLVTTGLADENSAVYRFGEKIAAKTYPMCSRIIVISDAIRRQLIQKGVDESRILTVGNWIDADKVKPVDKAQNKLYEEFDLPRDRFLVVYAGNLGAAQGAGVVLKAAELLKETADIRFVIFGGGAGFDDAVDTVRRQGLTNVSIYPLQPYERVSEVYSLGDIALITCKKGTGKTAMPSKLYSIMACNTPIIAAFDTDSELAAALNTAKAGVCVEPENAAALAAAIKAAFRERGKASSGGREYVMQFASKQACAAQYVRAIESAVNPTG